MHAVLRKYVYNITQQQQHCTIKDVLVSLAHRNASFIPSKQML